LLGHLFTVERIGQLNQDACAIAHQLVGTYRTPVIYAEVKAVFTNTVPVDAYRGAGRPEATFLLERLVERVSSNTSDESAGMITEDADDFLSPERHARATAVCVRAHGRAPCDGR
jgi:hypothetical protein